MKIVVLAGGISTERDVSLISGAGILKALRQRGHQAILLDVFLGYKKRGDDVSNIFEKSDEMDDHVNDIQAVDPDIESVKKLRDGDEKGLFGPNVIEICRQADIVYMGLHGADGENGKVQAAFDILGIRYTGSDYLGSALAMDKGMAKKVFLQSGIPTPNGFSMKKSHVTKLPDEIGYPCIVKPCCGGSSVGMSIAKNEEEKRQIHAKAILSDYYLMSTNAFTIDGQLVNIDGNGNRVSALCYGPKHVVIITGMNKLVPSVDAAYKRIRQDACPPNCVRLGLTNPCSKTGICGECMSASSICDLFVTTRMSRYPDRIHVIMVGEELGY